MTHSGIQDSSKSGYSCMLDRGSLLNFGAIVNEDCLTLNVFTPAGASSGDNLPVLVYVYGGGFTGGFANYFPFIQGANDIISNDQDVIIVMMNYRLGVFGYLPAEELSESGDLNLGFQDVIAAFEWVRKYISIFGGNSRQVTAFGFSAGAITLNSLMFAKNGTLDLFDRVFLQSGFPVPLLESPTTGLPVVGLLKKLSGCNGTLYVECLRNLTADNLQSAGFQTDQIINSPLSTTWGPILDGNIMTMQPYQSLEQGLFRKIPLMMQLAVDEGNFFASKYQKTKNEAREFRSRVFGYLNHTERRIFRKLYPIAGNSFQNLSVAMTDLFFSCPSRKMARIFTEYGLPVHKVILSFMFRQCLSTLWASQRILVVSKGYRMEAI